MGWDGVSGGLCRGSAASGRGRGLIGWAGGDTARWFGASGVFDLHERV